jgi:hypothetical protein
VSINAITCCWSGSPMAHDWWGLYKWILLGMLILDFLSIVLMLYSKHRISQSHIELQNWFQMADKETMGVVPKNP